jgi:hypothetical protein
MTVKQSGMKDNFQCRHGVYHKKLLRFKKMLSSTQQQGIAWRSFYLAEIRNYGIVARISVPHKPAYRGLWFLGSGICPVLIAVIIRFKRRIHACKTAVIHSLSQLQKAYKQGRGAMSLLRDDQTRFDIQE